MRVAVNGVRLFFDVDGAKLRPDGPWLKDHPTVIVIHTGPGVDHLPYKEHIGPVLAEVAQVIYLDLRGHGRSEGGPRGTWNVGSWSEDLLAFVERLEIERPVILGAGWGAFTALRFAARWPDVPGKLVLANPNARFVPHRSVAAFDELAGPEVGEVALRYFQEPNEQTLGEFLRVCFPHVIGVPAAADALIRPEWRLEMTQHWAQTEMRSLDLRADLAAIEAPTLVVAGDSDPQYPRASIEEVVEGIRDARVRWFPGARHSVFRDAPESFAVVRDFVVAP